MDGKRKASAKAAEALEGGRRAPRRRSEAILPGGARVRCRLIEVALIGGGKLRPPLADLYSQPGWVMTSLGGADVLYPLSRVLSVRVADAVAAGSAGPNPVYRGMDPALLGGD